MKHRRLLIVLMLLDIPLFAGVAWYWVSWRPWLADPSEPAASIDQRWADLSNAATRPGIADSGQAVLTTALEDLRTIRTTLESLVGPRMVDDFPVLDDATLPPAAASALDRLSEWHRSGTTALDPCSRNVRPVELILLCRLALATASRSADGPRVEAVLHLAQRLRTDGGPVGAALGTQVALMVANWASAGHVRALPLLEKYRPTPDEVVAAWAYGSSCDYALASRDLGQLSRIGPLARWGFSLSASNGPPLSLVQPDRELLFARKTLVDDWDRFRAAFGQGPGATGDIPDFDPATRSILARILAGQGREMGGRLARTIAEFDAAVVSLHGGSAEAEAPAGAASPAL